MEGCFSRSAKNANLAHLNRWTSNSTFSHSFQITSHPNPINASPQKASFDSNSSFYQHIEYLYRFYSFGREKSYRSYNILPSMKRYLDFPFCSKHCHQNSCSGPRQNLFGAFSTKCSSSSQTILSVHLVDLSRIESLRNFVFQTANYHSTSENQISSKWIQRQVSSSTLHGSVH